MLGQRVVCPIGPANQHIILQIDKFLTSSWQRSYGMTPRSNSAPNCHSWGLLSSVFNKRSIVSWAIMSPGFCQFQSELLKVEFQNLSPYIMIGRLFQQALHNGQTFPPCDTYSAHQFQQAVDYMIIWNITRVLYMSSSFWLLLVESHDFSQAEKERTAYTVNVCRDLRGKYILCL